MSKKTLVKHGITSLCRSTFSYISELKSNRETHRKEEAYSCKVHKSAFSKILSLKIHMQKDSTEKTFFVIGMDPSSYAIQIQKNTC